MSAFFEWMAYGLIAFAALVFLAMFVGRRLRAAAEVVERARNDLGDDICRHGVCPHECPSCRPMPEPYLPEAVWDACVAAPNPSVAGRASGDDIVFSASLARMEEELDLITEGGYRLPEERAS